MPTQQLLDFELPADAQERRRRMREIRAHWFALLEAAENQPLLTAGRRRRAIAALKRLLKSELSSWDGTAVFRQKWLAREWMVSRRSLANWLTWAAELGAIEWTVDADEKGCRRTTVQFTWGSLAAACGLPPLPNQCATVTDQSATVTDQSATVTDQSATVADQCATVAQYSGTRFTGNPPAPGPDSQAAPPPPDSAPNGWGRREVVKMRETLAAAGVDALDYAVKAAQRNGLSPADVRAIVAVAEAAEINGVRAYGGGAVYVRILNACPGQDFSDLSRWIAPTAEYQRERDRAAAAGRRRSEASRERREAEAAVRQEQRFADLEARYGARVDALDREQAAALLPADEFTQSVFAKSPGLYRLQLLEAMESCTRAP